MRSRLTSTILAVVALLVACGNDPDLARPEPTSAPTASPTGEPSPTELAADPTAEPTPTASPSSEPANTPSPVVEGGWTTFTADDGLPGNDIAAVDVNADGTLWATIAIERTDRGEPGRVSFARFHEGAWETLEPSPELDGLMQVAAGPDGSAWVVGSGEYFGNQGPQDGGTPGVWRFDAATWQEIQREPDPGQPLPVQDVDVGADGVLWATGLANATSGATGVVRHDGETWTTFAFPPHLFDCIDCQGLFLDPAGTVWFSYTDLLDDRQISYLARLDGHGPVEIPVDVFDLLPTTRAGLSLDVDRTWSLDGTYALLGVGDVSQELPGVPLPVTGDQVPFAALTFDGTAWTEIGPGELSIADGHTLVSGVVAGEGTTGGPVHFSVAHRSGTLFAVGLGGLVTIDTTGKVSMLTVADGLASNRTNDVAVGPDGVVWIATDAGVSRYVPAAT